MNKGVIFDLDQTLVDSRHLENFRKSKDWKGVNNRIHTLLEYPNISNIIRFLNKKNIKIAIVSSAPKNYCVNVVNYFHWKIDYIIGYHDVKPFIKPHFKGYKLAIEMLELNPSKTIIVGDRNIDIQPANNMGLKSIGCVYGNTDLNSKESLPTFIAETTDDVFNTLKEFFMLID